MKNGYLLEDGRLTTPIKDVNIIGNGPKVLEKVDMVSDDLKGAQDACADVYRMREVSVDWRDGKGEKIHEATTRGEYLKLFVDGRYASGSTSDLRPESLATFVQESVAVARTLAKNPARGLAEPGLFSRASLRRCSGVTSA